MAIYAIIKNGAVINLIVWDGDAEAWQPDPGTTAVPVPEGSPAAIGWTWDGTQFAAPPSAPVTPPTADQILATNTAQRNFRLDAASRAMAPLQDAVDLGEATPSETTLLTQWKQYRVAVNRVDLTSATPTWPAPPGQLSYGTTAVT